jgi:hypothetical protein
MSGFTLHLVFYVEHYTAVYNAYCARQLNWRIGDTKYHVSCTCALKKKAARMKTAHVYKRRLVDGPSGKSPARGPRRAGGQDGVESSNVGNFGAGQPGGRDLGSKTNSGPRALTEQRWQAA